MITREAFLQAVKIINEYKEQQLRQQKEDSKIIYESSIDEETLLEDLDMSIRVYNLLKWNRINRIGELKSIEKLPVRRYGFGEKAKKEIYELCRKAGFECKLK